LGKEEELKELIKELKKALARISYTPRSSYKAKLQYAPRGYARKQSYAVRHDFRYHPEPNPKPKEEKPSYHGGKVWTEPTPYKLEKERLVYDPEVKELLKRIEKHLAESKPDAEELLKQLESNPELYNEISEKLMERMDYDFSKQLEAVKSKEEEESGPLPKDSKASEEQESEVSLEQEKADDAKPDESVPQEKLSESQSSGEVASQPSAVDGKS